MKKAEVTKTIKRVEKIIEKGKKDKFYNVSLGFARLTSLSKKVRLNFDIEANVKTNWDGNKALNMQINFLNNLTNEEFNEWLMAR